MSNSVKIAAVKSFMRILKMQTRLNSVQTADLKWMKILSSARHPTSPESRAVVQNTVPTNQKSPALAAILSFLIVGLGQIYLGLTKKGILLFIGAVISGFLMLIIIGWITWLIVWGYAIYDAYNSANKINMGIHVNDTIDFNDL